MKKVKIALFSLVMVLSLVSCGNAGYKDGTYTGEYARESSNSKMVVELTIANNEITDCSLKSYQEDGKLKDETYGEGLDDKNKELAQLAYQGMVQYPDLLIDMQNVDEIDAIAGATVSYKEFKEAVKDALNKAK